MPLDDPSDLNAENRTLKKRVERLEAGTGASGDSSHAGSGADSIQLGTDANASGDESVALGYDTLATAHRAFAIGSSARADHDDSGAIGRGVATEKSNQIVIGLNVTEVFIQGWLRLRSYTPSGSSDPGPSSVANGDMASDDNYLYRKTASGWKRIAWSSF